MQKGSAWRAIGRAKAISKYEKPKFSESRAVNNQKP